MFTYLRSARHVAFRNPKRQPSGVIKSNVIFALIDVGDIQYGRSLPDGTD